MVLKEITGGGSLLRQPGNSYYVCGVSGSSAALSNGNYRNADGVCPLVALKPGIGVEIEIEITDTETIAENPQKLLWKENIKLHSRRANIQNILCRQAK